VASTSTSDFLADGTYDFSGGVDSSKVTTIKSGMNPNGLHRNQVAWLNNATVRGGSITQRTGNQPLFKLIAAGRWQGGFPYEPDSANPYLVCSISGRIYSALLEPPYTIRDLSAAFGLFNPPNAEIAWFCQGENYLIIQAGDFYTNPVPTLPLFWNGTVLRRSIGITNPAPAQAPHQNEIPAATEMDYYGQRIWYGYARAIAAGDMAGGPSGIAPGNPGYNHRRDSILSVTENPLCFSGDGFSLPTNAGNIRAIKHCAKLSAAYGQGQLNIFTRKTV
jgi:hypothetical protein